MGPGSSILALRPGFDIVLAGVPFEADHFVFCDGILLTEHDNLAVGLHHVAATVVLHVDLVASDQVPERRVDRLGPTYSIWMPRVHVAERQDDSPWAARRHAFPRDLVVHDYA